MWEVRVTQKYTSDHGIDLEETVVFRVNNLTKAGVIVDVGMSASSMNDSKESS